METSIKVKRLADCGYNFDALKYFLESAYEIKVNDVMVVLEGRGYVPNKDLIVSAEFPAGKFNCVIRKDLDESSYNFYIINTYEPEMHYISKAVMSLIYPVNKNKVSKYDIVKKIDAAIASGKIKNDDLYLENLCDVIEVDSACGYEIDGSKMMERDIDLLMSFSTSYAAENSNDAEYRYDMMKNTKISDDDKLDLMLSKNGITSGIDAELMAVEKGMKEISKTIAKTSGVCTTEGVTYTFTSNGSTFKGFMN